MVDKLKDAASFLKAKWNKDELTELLMTSMNDEQCQTSTTILHQIANATYVSDQWIKIWQFVLEKLQSGKWVRVNKALIVLEFILKNGNQGIIRDIKDQIRVIRDLEDFTAKGQTQLRISSTRRKATAVLQLLNNSRRLEQQRNQAESIKTKLRGNIYTNKPSSNMGSSKTSKVSYQGIGSTYYPKQESSTNKVSGITSSIVKGIANTFKGKSSELIQYESQSKKYPNAYLNDFQPKVEAEKKPASKLFSNFNVKKPSGITKTHGIQKNSNTTKSEIKSSVNSPNQTNNNTLDIFEFGQSSVTDSKVQVKVQNDIFSFDTSSPQIPLKQSQPSSFVNLDFLPVSTDSSINTPKFPSTVTITNSDIFSFGQPNSIMNSNFTNNNTMITKQQPQPNFNIFQTSNNPFQIKTQIKMNSTINTQTKNNEPQSKYDMFQQFLI